jgi:Helix-turn-helix domain
MSIVWSYFMTRNDGPYEVTFFTIDEAAKLLRVHRRTLDNLRWKKQGPRFRRHGGRIVYELKDLLDWSEQRRARFEPAGQSKKTPSLRDGHACSWRPGAHVPKGKHPKPRLEPQPERPSRPLSANFTGSTYECAGGHPFARAIQQTR